MVTYMLLCRILVAISSFSLYLHSFGTDCNCKSLSIYEFLFGYYLLHLFSGYMRVKSFTTSFKCD
jgi:hypothetical protein